MWNPFDEFERNLTLLGDENKGLTKWSRGFRAPAADIRETKNSVIAEIELPGADKNDIDLNVTEDSIEVKAEKKHEKEVKGKGKYEYSSSSSSFYRKMPLPSEIDSNKATANYRNGILRVEAPKTEKSREKRKKIEIK